MIKKEEPKLKNYNKSNVTYNIKHSFIVIVKSLIIFLSNQSIRFCTNFLNI